MVEGKLNNKNGTNVSKYKVMTCHLEYIRSRISEEEFGQQSTGMGAEYK